MGAGRLYPCTRKGCTGTRARRRFLCAVHWRLLPGDIQRRIARAAARGMDLTDLRATAHAHLDHIEQQASQAAQRASNAYADIQRLTGDHDFQEAAE